MASRGNNATTGDDEGKSRFAIIGAILFLILVVSFAFFWVGNITYGLLMLVIPSLSVIISTCCYMSEQNDEEEPSEVFQVDFPSSENVQPRTPDRPPSYRQTWRRSFIKRLRTARQAFSDTDKDEPEPDRQDPESPKSEEPVVVDTPELISVEVSESADEPPKTENPSMGASESNLKYPVVPKDSLPTYEEIVDIMKSIEDLSRLMDDEEEPGSDSLPS